MAIYSDLGGSSAPVDPGLTEAEALLEAKKVSGYLGLLTSYYFGGTGTTTTITPAQANQWVDVNLTVDPAGTFDFRPQDMVDADATGFEGSGTAASGATVLTVVGNVPVGASHNQFTDVDLSASATGYRLRTLYDANNTQWRFLLQLDGAGFNGAFGTVAEGIATYSAVDGSFVSGDISVSDGTVTVDYSAVVESGATNTVVLTGDNASAGDPYLFTLCGLTQQSFGKMRVTALYNPDIDESQLDVRLLFTPNSSGQFGQFAIAEQAATMSQGAGAEYFIEPTITFFVGDSIEEIGTVGASDAGRVQLQIRSSVEGEFTLRGLTLYIHS